MTIIEDFDIGGDGEIGITSRCDRGDVDGLVVNDISVLINSGHQTPLGELSTKIGHREGVLSPNTDEHLARLSRCPILG